MTHGDPNDGATEHERGAAGSAGGGSRWRDLEAMAAATLGRCPACREGRAFRGAYALAATCPVCGVRFERDPGSWLGAAVIAYALAVLVTATVAVVLVRRHGLFVGLEWWLVGAGLVTVVAVYRPVKGWWLWCMWAAGWVHRDAPWSDS